VWFPGETVIASIGQGYMLASPLQLANATAALAARASVSSRTWSLHSTIR